MKKIILLFVATIFLTNTHVLSVEKKTSFFKPWNSKNTSKDVSAGKTLKKKEKFFKPWNSKNISKNDNSIINKKNKSFSQKNKINDTRQNISLYTGTFDTIDKEGDEKTSLVGIEHKNKNLFRDTLLGRFSPTTGGFFTGKSSVYLYTGIEADYNLGPINISPSFAPGYYEAGDGKNLGSALEFKSEVKIGVDLFKNSNLGYSYSHISNNDWGDVNPGTDNQSITFSKKF
jgi:lipid A 3-O-deacylase